MALAFHNDVDNFLQLAECLVLYVKHCYEDEEDEDIKDDILRAVEDVLRYGVLVIDDQDGRYEVIEFLRNLALTMKNVGSSSSSSRGRPRLNVGEEQLTYLIEQGFRVEDISDIFGCSRRTIQRRMSEFSISIFNSAISVADAHLDSFVKEVTTLFPRCGEKTISGRLRSCNIRVPRQRIRESLIRVDPSGVLSRCKGVLHRRKYYVPSPNSLWHVDGYHKLIRWRLVIHGCIDGYSRLVTYLKVSSNNLSSTVIDAFVEAIWFAISCTDG